MKICLFGATGLLGSEFKKIFRNENLNFIAPSRGEVQLLDFRGTLKYLEKESPDIIVHCAAYTNVDQAESDQENCESLNVDVVRNLTKSGIAMIHFSTDYVFDVPENIEIPEDYEKSPQSTYGKSKAQAEEILELSSIDWWNIRTSWLFGSEGKNFVSTILKLSKNKTELEIIDDQIGLPTYAPDLAQFVVDNFIKATQDPGHYHLQNSGEPVSWAKFAKYFLDLKNWKGEIIPITTKDFGAAAARPKNSVLKNTKINHNLDDWKKSIKKYLK